MPQQRNSPITCVICGTTVLVTLQSAAKQQTCSITCCGLARRGKFFGQRATANRICHVCDRPFHAKQVHIDAGNAKFCSNGCRGAAIQVPLTIPEQTESLIYMAGIIDGEGTITLGSTGAPRIMVANSSAVLMEWIVRTFGGRLQTPRQPRKPNHRQVLCWYMGSAQSVALCRLLHPYLKVKARQSALVMALSRANLAETMTEIRVLNKRGL